MTSIGIIGSGHAGVAAAKALVRRGYKPIILDVGERLDPSRQKLVTELADQPHANWDPTPLRVVTDNPTVKSERPVRLAYGSDYVYGRRREWTNDSFREHGPAPSYAKGGYSTVWGGAMLPADSGDLTDWPAQARDLSKWYTAVLKDLPFSAVNDELTSCFPLYAAPEDPLNTQPIVQAFLTSLRKSKKLREDSTVAFGRARLAVRAGSEHEANRCTYCGRCLSGCVYNAIQSSSTDLDQMIAAGQVEYRPGVIAESLKEENNYISVLSTDRDKVRTTFNFNHLFLAAGAVSSTRIFMNSSRIYNHELRMLTTQGFALPILRLKHSPFRWPNTNTLTGMFLELKLPQLSRHWIHCQVSQANELVLQKMGFDENSTALLNRAKKRALGHLMIALCNFHSRDAAHYGLTLTKTQTGKTSLQINTHASKTYPAISKAAGRRLTKLLIHTGSIPLMLLKHGSNKRPMGWHFGGSMPMKNQPDQQWETDIYGTPRDWKRLSIVDSSVFPALPGTTIALLAMANSQRIASEVPINTN